MELVVREYLGSAIEFKMINGEVYANATQMCKPFGKLFADWKRLKQTEDMIEEVSEAMGIPIGDLTLVENGKSSFIHEELILELASWLNVKFRRWCQVQIISLIREGSVSLKPKSEEEMLLELFPNTDNNLICLTAKSIRQARELTLTVAHKTEVIDHLTSDVDPVILRKASFDYVNKIAIRTGTPHAQIWTEVYSLLGRDLKIDIKHRHEKYKKEQHKLVVDNKMYNYENKLKGEDRKFPITLKDSGANISQLEYICKILGQGGRLMECIAKIADVSLEDVINKYKAYELKGGN